MKPNNSHIFFKFILYFTASVAPCASYAEPPAKEIIFIKFPGKYPNLPSSVWINCIYEDGLLKFTIPEDIEYLSIFITKSENIILQDIVTASEPNVEVVLSSGQYRLVCVADSGETFESDLLL